MKNVEDVDRSALPSTSQTDINTAGMREIVRFHRKMFVKMIAEEVKINREPSKGETH